MPQFFRHHALHDVYFFLDLINFQGDLKKGRFDFIQILSNFFSFLPSYAWDILSDKFLIFFIFSSHCRFQIDKRCQHRCSWKCFSIALILLSIVLATMVAYFASKSLVIFLLTLEYPCHVQILLKWKWEFFHHFEAFFLNEKLFLGLFLSSERRHTHKKQKRGEKVKSFTIVKLLEWFLKGTKWN